MIYYGIMRSVPKDSEPTAYITSLEEFVSVIGKNYFCQLGYDLLGFSEN